MSSFWTVFCLSLVLSASPVLTSWGAEGFEVQPRLHPMSKITFDLAQLNKDGLYGPPDGLRALHYEFCIPGDPAHEAQVRSIDPTIEIAKKSRGRIGCTEGDFLCMGNTHQSNFNKVLLRLANLPYVKRIDQTFFE